MSVLNNGVYYLIVFLSGIAFEKQKLGVTLKYDKQDPIDLQKFQNKPCAGPQKPAELTHLKIKYETFSPKIHHRKLYVKHVKDTQICGL